MRLLTPTARFLDETVRGSQIMSLPHVHKNVTRQICTAFPDETIHFGRYSLTKRFCLVNSEYFDCIERRVGHKQQLTCKQPLFALSVVCFTVTRESTGTRLVAECPCPAA